MTSVTYKLYNNVIVKVCRLDHAIQNPLTDLAIGGYGVIAVGHVGKACLEARLGFVGVGC